MKEKFEIIKTGDIKDIGHSGLYKSELRVQLEQQLSKLKKDESLKITNIDYNRIKAIRAVVYYLNKQSNKYSTKSNANKDTIYIFLERN